MATIRQLEAARIYIRKLNEKKRSKKPIKMAEILREAGYSNEIIEHPKKVLESRGWRDLMEEYLSDDLTLSQLKKNIQNRSGFVSNSALDMAFKLKGKYVADKKNPEDPYEKMTDEELTKRLQDLENQKKALEEPKTPTDTV